MRIQTRLLILVYSVLVPAFAAGAIAVWLVYTEQKQAQEKGLQEAARATGLLVDKELERIATMLNVLAASPALRSTDLTTFQRFAKDAARDAESVIVLSDLAGRQVLNTRAPLDAALPKLNADLLNLRRESGERATIVSNLFRARTIDRYDIAVQVPVVIDGVVRFYLATGFPANAMTQVLKAHGFPSNWIGSVVDRHAVIVARTEAAERYIGKAATGSIADKLRSGAPHGTNDGLSLDGRPVMAYFHRAPMSQWTVVISVPAAELRAPAVNAAVLLGGLVLIMLAAAFLAARHYAHQTSAPIHALQDDAVRLGRGEPVMRHAIAVVELDALNAALVDASRQQRDSKSELERRVAEAVHKAEYAQRALLQAQKLEALGRLTGGIAHDFNNVLQTLTMSMQLIRAERDPERLSERIAVCERAIAGATNLIAQLRAFGRVHQINLETKPTAEAIEAVLPLLRNAVSATVRVESVLADQLWPVTIDPVQFEMALLNLVMNARDAMPNGGTVALHAVNETVQASATPVANGDYVRISVADTGIGMPPEVLHRALEPFFTTKPVDRGTGLGLAQVYGFATQSGGTVILDSVVGVGTSVAIYLPRAQQSVFVAPAAKAVPAVHAGIAAKVLFVEDDGLVRASVIPVLVEAGCTVMTAENGDEALVQLQHGASPDIVFSDIVMPGATNGIALARWLHAHAPGIGVVLATGYAGEAVDVPGVRLLPKPYSAATMLQALADAASARVA
ncbi:response regulator [Oxalobacteraceae bacterium OM1]|nr:response regulator [Oxalobacteraceae bacterium OM1]